jgi:chaperonin cofactor prefoldin
LFASKDGSNGTAQSQPAPAGSGRLSQLETELAAARRSEETKTARFTELQGKLNDAQQSVDAKTARLSRLETELAAVRRVEGTKSARLAQLEGQLAAAGQSDDAKASRLTQLEAELVAARSSEAEKATRLSELEGKLKTARQSVDQAQAATKRIESTQGPRSITPEQRTQFLAAVRGLSTGKVLISAFFENKETHEFGAELLNLLKEAGFKVVESAPVNFFTTSRPSSGIRIGCQDITQAPAHFATVRKGLEAIGLDVSNTSIVNAEASDVVEIQITPKQ